MVSCIRSSSYGEKNTAVCSVSGLSMGFLQYRAAAAAGVATQFAFWGAMELWMFRAFLPGRSVCLPMSISQLAAYIWLQQAFFGAVHDLVSGKRYLRMHHPRRRRL